MPTSPLAARVLGAAIALQLSIAGPVLVAGGPRSQVTASLERAEMLPTAGFVGRDVAAAGTTCRRPRRFRVELPPRRLRAAGPQPPA